jgi:hypothetical protein
MVLAYESSGEKWVGLSTRCLVDLVVWYSRWMRKWVLHFGMLLGGPKCTSCFSLLVYGFFVPNGQGVS